MPRLARPSAFLLALAACGHAGARSVTAPPPPATAATAETASLPRPPIPTGTGVSVYLAHAGGDRWIVDYALPEPTRALAFREGRVPRDAWRVLDPPGATLVSRYVVSALPFDRLRLEIPTSTAQPDKAYRPFYRYSDRGWLAYTGQLDVLRASCGIGDCMDGRGLALGAEYSGDLTLIAAPGESVVVQGKPAALRATVRIGDHRTYAYFGDLAPVETPGFTGVLDRGMPASMRDRVAEDLPRLFAFYASRLGALDGPRPTVFLTFAARAHGVSVGGGVLPPHVVTLDLELDPARLADGAAALLDVDRLVAHEAAHFWNADMHPAAGGPGAAWLDEGSADAMAARALHTLGVLDDTAYSAVLSEAASECALWLSGGEPLTAAARPGHARAQYVCGSTLSLAAEAAVRRRDPGADLFTFWRAVFDEGRPGYDESTFVRVLDRLAGAPAVTSAIERIVHERSDDPARAVRDVLRVAGVETTTIPRGAVPAAYEEHGSIPAMDALLPRACARALRFDGDVEVRPVVDADGACPGLSRGDVIDLLAGVPLGPRGASALQAAFAACRERRSVDVVTSARARVTLPCDPQAREAPSYFEIVATP